MLVEPIDKLKQPHISFGIYKGTKIKRYAPTSYIKTDYGETKNHLIEIRRDYIHNEFCSTLFYIKDKAGKWVKSLLKYKVNGKWKTMRSEAK